MNIPSDLIISPVVSRRPVLEQPVTSTPITVQSIPLPEGTRTIRKPMRPLSPRRLNFSSGGTLTDMEEVGAHITRGMTEHLNKSAFARALTTLEKHRMRLNVIMWHLTPIYKCADCDEEVTLCHACIKTLRECTERLVLLNEFYEDYCVDREESEGSKNNGANVTYV